jgi:hypothetical protein
MDPCVTIGVQWRFNEATPSDSRRPGDGVCRLRKSDESPRPARAGPCPDSPAPIYVLAAGPSLRADDLLMTFDPPTGAFATVASVPCLGFLRLPTAMAIDRVGDAYIVSRSDFNRLLFRMSTATGGCELVPFTPPLASTSMAFSEDRGGASETLYMTTTGLSLTGIDTSTFMSRAIGQIAGVPWAGPNQSDTAPLLTGSGDGDLFVVASSSKPSPTCASDIDASVPPGPPAPSGAPPCKRQTAQPSDPQVADIGRVDTSNASVTTAWTVTTSLNLGATPLQGFAFWGGDFYLFAPQGSGSAVLRFRPSDESTVQVGQTEATVLAVAVSTCAPLR